MIYLLDSQCAEVYTAVVMVSMVAFGLDFNYLLLSKHWICVWLYYCSIVIFLTFPIVVQQDYKQVTSMWPEQCHWAVGVYPFKCVRLAAACPTLGRSRSDKPQLFSPYLPQSLVLSAASQSSRAVSYLQGCRTLLKSTFMLCTVHFHPLFSHLMTRMICFILVECVDILSECMVVHRDGWLWNFHYKMDI